MVAREDKVSARRCDNPSPHGWTLDTLEEFLSSKIVALDKFFTAEFRSSKEAVQSALLAVEKQSNAAMTAAEKAIMKSDAATEKRFDSVNEFRQTLSDQAADFLSRKEYEANHKSLEEKFIGAMDRIAKIETQKETKTEGMNFTGAIIIGAFAVLSAIGNVVTVFFALSRP